MAGLIRDCAEADGRIAEIAAKRDRLQARARKLVRAVLTMRDERDAARAEAEANRLDAERYRVLCALYYAADFAYPEIGAALIFKWPGKARISANLDSTIDAAREGGK